MVKKKKIFPKLKKKLKGFLTDESGKISKKDALGLAAGAVLLSGVDEVDATVGSWVAPHKPGASGHSNFVGTCTVATPSAVHASGIVNGHYSNNVTSPTPTATWGQPSSGHSSHGSHGSHGSHCNCSRWT